MDFNQEEFNDFVLENNVIGFFEQPIKLKSGRMTNWYVNWRINDVFLIDKLSDFVIAFIKGKGLNPDCFFGVPEGATKLGIITQHKWAKQSLDYGETSYVLPMGRGKPKEHGNIKDRFFVGEPEGKIIVLEDVTTTGGSLLTTIDSLQQAGFSIMAAVSLTNRMELRDDRQSVKQAVESKGVSYYNLSNALQLLPEVYKKLQPGEGIGRAIESEFKEHGIEQINLISPETNKVDRLLEKIDEKKNPCVVGLDPVLERIPKHLINGDSFEDVAEAFRKFNFAIIDAVCDLVPAVKPQIAFYEKYGSEGVKAFKDTVDYAKSKGLIVIEDGKRNDIGSTAQAYADGHLGSVKTQASDKPSFDLDFLTVNPYLGSDGINPFFEVCKEHGKGIFILVKTSNPSSGEFQDRLVEVNPDEREQLISKGIEVYDKTQLYNLVALNVNKYAQQFIGARGYSPIGAVVGATYPEQAETLRKIMPNSFFLVPGYGAQGGGGEGVIPCFNKDGYGAVVNSSRGIIFAYEKYKDPERFAEVAREATQEMIRDIVGALARSGKLPEAWRNNF